jgi:hypothetical protein
VLSTRTNSSGDTLYILEATDDEITNKQQALISKNIRTQGLRLIPGDIVDECMEQVLLTLRAADAQDPDAAKRKLFDAFGELGVRAEQLKEYLGHDATTLAPKELNDLRSLYAAIRDGEATWRDVMDAREAKAADKPPTTGGAKIDELIAKGRKSKGAATPKPASEPADVAQADAPLSPPAQTLAQFIEALERAPEAEEAALVIDRAHSMLAPEDYAQAQAVYRKRWVE